MKNDAPTGTAQPLDTRRGARGARRLCHRRDDRHLPRCRTALPVGLTVNSFNALSLEPPLVLWSLRLASPNLAAFDAASHFAVNVLAESQVELSRRFASSLPDKFDEGLWLNGMRGRAACWPAARRRSSARSVSHQTGGDHRLYIGRVLARAVAAGAAAAVPRRALPPVGRDPVMPAPIEGQWVAAFVEVLQRCGVRPGDSCAVLSESQSRPVLPQLAVLALRADRRTALHI